MKRVETVVVLVGGGPGPADLVTVRGRAQLLRAQHLVVTPPAVAGLVQLCPQAAVREIVGGSVEGAFPEAVVARVADAARAGARVVWLVPGDAAGPRYATLREALRSAGVALEVVPGPTSAGEGRVSPLAGRRVLVTRARQQAGPTCEALEALGAEVVCLPTIQFAAPVDDEPLRRAAGRLEEYDWLIVTSANAVEPLWTSVRAAGRDARAFANLRICAIGPGTAQALSGMGLCADLIPEDHRAEGVLAALAEEPLAAKRVLIPRAAVAREVLPETLRARGAEVDVVPAYRTVLPEPEQTAEGLDAVRRGEVDVLTFTSASTVDHFAELVGADLAASVAGRTIVAIGPVTAAACARHGLPVHVVPETFTLSTMIDALVRHVAEKGR